MFGFEKDGGLNGEENRPLYVQRGPVGPGAYSPGIWQVQRAHSICSIHLSMGTYTSTNHMQNKVNKLRDNYHLTSFYIIDHAFGNKFNFKISTREVKLSLLIQRRINFFIHDFNTKSESSNFVNIS